MPCPKEFNQSRNPMLMFMLSVLNPPIPPCFILYASIGTLYTVHMQSAIITMKYDHFKESLLTLIKAGQP